MQALAPSQFAALLQPLLPPDTHPHLAIAVSGGADSMALLLLAVEWSKASGAAITALTVDHGLRKEAEAECAQVARWCEELGVSHYTLRWKAPVLTSAVQEQAREARYQLLQAHCREHGIATILTAHHQGDQAETLFFRLARGSGMDGLAAIRPLVALDDAILLLRPLLGISKAQLMATLKAAGQDWIEDPSNQNPNYTRNRIRALIAQTGRAESIGQRAYAISQSFLRIRNLLESHTASKLTACLVSRSDTHLIIDSAAFIELEPEYGLRVLTAMVQKIGKGEHKPRSEKLERFYAQLCEDIRNRGAKTRSFAHCLFTPSPKDDRLLVTIEP